MRLAPDLSDYTQTIPYFVCTYAMNDCMQACSAADVSCAEGCTRDKICTAPHPKSYPQVSGSATLQANNENMKPTDSVEMQTMLASLGTNSTQTSSSDKPQSAILQVYMLAIVAFICLFM